MHEPSLLLIFLNSTFSRTNCGTCYCLAGKQPFSYLTIRIDNNELSLCSSLFDHNVSSALPRYRHSVDSIIRNLFVYTFDILPANCLPMHKQILELQIIYTWAHPYCSHSKHGRHITPSTRHASYNGLTGYRRPSHWQAAITKGQDLCKREQWTTASDQTRGSESASPSRRSRFDEEQFCLSGLSWCPAIVKCSWYRKLGLSHHREWLHSHT